MEASNVLPDESILCSLRPDVNLSNNAYLLKCFEYSVKSNTYRILRDEAGAPCGYIIWADVNRESIQKIIRVGAYPSFFYEWQEGNITLLIDVFNKCNSPFVLTQIIDCIYKKRIIFYKIRNKSALKIRSQNIFYKIPIDRINKSLSKSN